MVFTAMGPTIVIQKSSTTVYKKNKIRRAESECSEILWNDNKEKKYKMKEPIKRPQTATLERPVVLDTCYLKKLDMSLTRKALLSITNLCKVPSVSVSKKPRIPSRKAAKVITAGTGGLKPKLEKDESWEDVSSDQDNKKKTNSPRKILKNDRQQQETPRNNKKSPVKNTPRAIPEPCRSCKRTDLPERLHSHPTIHTKVINKKQQPQVPAVTISRPVKSSVQRPIPIKYKSTNNKIKKENENIKNNKDGSPRSLASSPRSFVIMEENNKSLKSTTTSNNNGPPRLLVCYLCGQKFGTASLPLHEPKCLEKWQRLNSKLPVSLQRNVPEKPNKPMTPEEWNEFAWKTTQANLINCKICNKTFLPDRLMIHLKTCKSTIQTVNNEDSVPKTPPCFVCYICGRNFGSRSLAIHEPQCLRRWKSENEKLAIDQRKAEPQKPSSLTNDKVDVPKHTSAISIVTSPKRRSNSVSPNRNNNNNISPRTSTLGLNITPTNLSSSPHRSPKTSPRSTSPLATCHICGRNFGSLSLPIHEPQCLRKWRHENDKLPPDKRLPEPRRSDVKYTDDGILNHEATFTAIWESHLGQLVPCKTCGRTFFPDRLEVHIRSCRAETPLKR